MRPALACWSLRPPVWLLAAVAAASLGTACERPAATALSAEIVLTPVAGSTTQSAAVGTAVPVAPSVRVTDVAGRPVVGVRVIFAPARGRGRVAGERATTDQNGVATVGSWTLGTVSGPQVLEAVVPSSTTDVRALFNATATPGAPGSIRVVPAHASIAPGGTQLLTVNLHDLYGNLITSGVAASFVAASPATTSVTPAGLVTGVGAGVTTITASFGGFTSLVRVGVGKEPSGASITTADIAYVPFAVAISSADVAYVGSRWGGGLSRFDLPGKMVTANIPALAVATDIAFLPNGAAAYVLQSGGRTVSVVDVATNSVRRSLVVSLQPPRGGYPPEEPPRALASPDGAYVYVATAWGDLFRIDTATDSISKLTLWRALGGLAISGTQPVLFVSAKYDGAIFDIALATFTLTRSRVIGGTPQGLAVSLDGSRLFVANEAGDLDVLSTVTLLRVATVSLGSGAFDVALTRNAGQLYVARAVWNDVVVLDADTYGHVRTIPGGIPRRIAFDVSGQLAVITNESGFVTFVR